MVAWREHFHESSKKRHSQLKEAEAARNEDGPDSQMLPGPNDRRLSVKAKKNVGVATRPSASSASSSGSQEEEAEAAGSGQPRGELPAQMDLELAISQHDNGSDPSAGLSC